MEQEKCCQSSSCCCNDSKVKEIVIDFLYLDLSVCARCQGTDANLEDAILEVSSVLKAAGYTIQVNKVNIISKELAYEYKFLSSPTIRINGKDIEIEVKESSCKECGDLCGDEVDCRVFTYEGKEYSQPPKEFIINAILREVYSDKTNEGMTEEAVPYEVPDNLKNFFDSFESKQAKH